MIRVFYCTGIDRTTGKKSWSFLLLPIHKKENQVRELSLEEIQDRLHDASFIVLEFRENPAYSTLVNMMYNAILPENSHDIRGTLDLITRALDGAVALSHEDTEIPRSIDFEFEIA